MRSSEVRIAVALLVLAFALRAWRAGDPPFPVADEVFHPQDAQAFVATGQTGGTSWPYPPMKHLLLVASMRAFGDNAWGWRLRNVVFGSATAALVALLGAALFPGRRRVGVIAGLLVAVDPLHILLSRTTEEEVLVAAFFLAATWAVVLHLHGRDTIPAASLSLGAAFATKPYYLAAAALLAVLVLVAAARSPAPWSAAARALAWLALVPPAIYLATFLPWFHRGYGLGEFVRFQLDAARAILGRGTEEFWYNWEFLVASGTAGRWFTTVGAGVARTCAPGGTPCRMFAVVRNYPVWLAVLPAAAVVAMRGVRRRDGADLLAGGLFAAAYLPMLLVSRPFFFYSSAIVFPFAALLVARLADLGADRRPRTVAAALAVAVFVAAYLYPIATLRRVP